MLRSYQNRLLTKLTIDGENMSAKYEAWEKLRGSSEEDAKTRYFERIRKPDSEF